MKSFSSSTDPNLVEAINILEKNKINYWVCHGTLLGIIRDKKLIEWDHDIDIAVWSHEISRKKILNIFLKNGFILRDGYGIKNNDIISFKKNSGRILDINFYNKTIKNGIIYANVERMIPRNVIMKIIDALSYGKDYNSSFKLIINSLDFLKNIFKILKKFLINNNFFYKKINFSEPYNYIENIRTISFLNIKIKIPCKPEVYLEHIYGHKWKIPQKKYTWHKDAKNLDH